jgi:radical SAM superfamily enzyme YgiQ (UPF0313 family)
VTCKVEHLLKRPDLLSLLRDTGCLFVTSAVEAVDDAILQILDKGHTRADFVQLAGLFRDVGLTLNPTFVAFNPWTTLDGYLDLLNLIAELDLVGHVAPIQYAIRLLIPAGSRLLELPQIQEMVAEFDEQALVYPWQHAERQVDRLQAQVLKAIKAGEAEGMSRREIFSQVWRLAWAMAGQSHRPAPSLPLNDLVARPIPHLSEPWYC